MSEKLLNKINQLDKDLSPEISDDSLLIKHPEFNFDKSFLIDGRNNDDIIQRGKGFSANKIFTRKMSL
jgi:hypothetical protein